MKGLVAERYGNSPRRRRGGLLRILVFPAMMLGIGVIAVNAYSNFVTGARAIGRSNIPAQQVESIRQPSTPQPEIQPKVDTRTAITKTDPDKGTRHVYQPPSEMYLAKQECNSLIAAALGNQGQRLLIDRDKACIRYKALKGEIQ